LELVVPLEAIPRDGLPLAGGKAVNLGQLLRAGLPVPPGFCLTTQAYTRAVERAELESLLDQVAGVLPDDQRLQAQIAAQIRDRIVATPIPPEVDEAVRQALHALGEDVPLAVRSSATAEDLPFASFAGQQDTYLNIIGVDAVLDAVRRCWASLWTDRAVTYRANNNIDPHTVWLAVVVQRLVDAAVAGVVFTANPLTGKRHETVVDASPGLGEAVVSGAVNPDHFVVDTLTGAVRERRLGDKRMAVRPTPGGGTEHVDVQTRAAEACLTDEQLRQLARLGERTQTEFGSPQDLEFALDTSGSIWLTQARPITTLFPVPARHGADMGDLRVYFNFNVAQGVFRPFTPMGLAAFRLISTSIATLWGFPPRDKYAGTPMLADAGGRIFLDATPLVRSTLGRRVAAMALSKMETRTLASLHALFEDPRLSPRPTSRLALVRTLGRFFGRTRLPLHIVRALIAPAAARRAVWRTREAIDADATLPANPGARQRLERAEYLLLTWPGRIFPAVVPLLIGGLGSLALAWRLLGDLVSNDEKDVITRALPHNPTTEMDLALWTLAHRTRSDSASATALRDRAPADLAKMYRAGTLPPRLQRGLAEFLESYGHRGVAEIDLGLPRWSDEPDHLLGVLSNYLADEGERGADVQFRDAALQAESMARTVVRRAERRAWWRGVAARLLLGHGRALAGTREIPKFMVVLVMARARSILTPIGPDLVNAGRLEHADDLWMLTLQEVRAALDGQDQRPLVRQRRAEYANERRRKQQPRLLLSDGTEPVIQAPADLGDGVLHGTAASAGRATARARVILDPIGASLAPGEILVAPSTDPGWTPLFLTAGGLVMEMGGAMSHGSVVAREYGIPAVVGVPAATERIQTGHMVTVDGSAGTVAVDSQE
jgi:rifampicin phosphotransferase